MPGTKTRTWTWKRTREGLPFPIPELGTKLHLPKKPKTLTSGQLEQDGHRSSFPLWVQARRNEVNSTTSIIRDIRDESWAVHRIPFRRIRFFNQFSMLKKKQEVFANYNKERGEKWNNVRIITPGAFNVSGEKYSHYINLQADFLNMLATRTSNKKKS